jgi:glycyl-tRNA synthetase alpha subunit
MKHRWFIGGLLLAGMVAISSQENSYPPIRDINGILSKNDFEEIVQFILNNGDGKIYCQMYNNNPHYALEDFHIYLDPVSQWINFRWDDLSYSVSDYNKIVIEDWNSPHRYYDIILANERVYLTNSYEVAPKEYYELLEKYITKLKSLIGK